MCHFEINFEYIIQMDDFPPVFEYLYFISKLLLRVSEYRDLYNLLPTQFMIINSCVLKVSIEG